MNGNGGAMGGADFPAGFAGLPGASAAGLSSASDLNNSSSVSMAPAAPAFALQGAGSAQGHGAQPPAKRIKMESPAGGAAPNAAFNMAAIATSRAMAGTAAMGSGMSTEQFLQALPAAYAVKNPAFMAMMQQHHQQQQQQQQQQQAQVQMQMQRQMQLQRQFGAPFAMSAQQPQQIATAQMQAQTQAQAIMMAAMAQNRAGMAIGLPQPQQVQQRAVAQVNMPPQTGGKMAQVAASTVLSTGKIPQPTEDPSCLICKEKGNDLFTCSSLCGLTAHHRCIGEEKILTTPLGAKVCGACFIMNQDRESKENLQKGGSTAISVRRAILCLNVETNAPTNFDKFGHLASLRLVEIAEIAGYPIAPFARKFVEPHLQRWVAEKLAHIASWQMNVRDVFTLMIGLYSLDRANIPHGWREKALELVKAKNFTTTDFLGWHPAIEGPDVRCSSLCSVCCLRNSPELNACSRCARPLLFPTIFTKFVSALLASHYAEHVGIAFGTTFLDVFAHTHSVRNHYKGLIPVDADGYAWEMFTDQMRMIFGLLDIVSNFGVLELDPELFEPEVKIIFNQQYVNQAMIFQEYEVVGKFLQCMKLFGSQKASQHREMIEITERFLLVRQLPNGSWCKLGATVVDQYKATVVCAKALLKPVIRGRGPISSDVHRLLVKWTKKTPGHPYAKRLEQIGSGKLLACGATVRGKTASNLKKLEVFYRRQIVPTSGLNSLEMLATARLKAIWPSQKSEQADEEVKEELMATTTDSEEGESAVVKEETTDENNGSGAEEEDTLTSLSLNGDLSLFDGLKFEDGDVIDIGQSTTDENGEDEKTEVANGEGDGDDQEENAAPQVGVDEADDTEDEDVYDDDNDADESNAQDEEIEQLPEPELTVEDTAGAPGDGQQPGIDLGDLSADLVLDDSYAQSSLDLTLDM